MTATANPITLHRHDHDPADSGAERRRRQAAQKEPRSA